MQERQILSSSEQSRRMGICTPSAAFGPVEPPSKKEREGKQVKDGFSSPELISLLHGTENWSVCYWPVKPGEYLYFVEVCRIKTLL